MTEGIKFYPHPPETHGPSESADSLGNENDTKSNAENRIQSINDAPNDMLKDRLGPEPCYAQRQAHIRCTIGAMLNMGWKGSASTANARKCSTRMNLSNRGSLQEKVHRESESMSLAESELRKGRSSGFELESEDW